MATRPVDAALPAARDRRLALLLAATFATCLLGWLFKAHCTFDGSWSGSEQYTTGCYSDAVPFWHGREIAAGKLPYFQSRMEYPVLTGALIFVEGRITTLLFGARAGSADFLFVVTACNAALALIVTRLLWAMRVAPARLWWWALAPPLILYVGHNWDMLAVALAVGALVFARRDRPVSAAMLAALGGAAKLFPLFLLPLLAWRPLLARRGWLVASIATAALAAWLAVNLPVAMLAPQNWGEFYRFSGERGGTAASVWELAGQFGWLNSTTAQRNLWSGMLFLAGAAAIVLAGQRHHRAAPWVLFTPVAIWFLLVNKVYSPQFDLWIYPLMLLTVRRVAPIALFVVSDLMAYFAEFWMFAGAEGAWPATGQPAILVAASVRGVALLWIIASAIAEPAPRWIAPADDGG